MNIGFDVIFDRLISCLIIEDVIKQKSHSPPIIVPQIGEKHKKKKEESDVAVSTMSTEEPQPLNNENHFIYGNDLPEEVRHIIIKCQQIQMKLLCCQSERMKHWQNNIQLSPKGRWLVVVIYRDKKRQGIYIHRSSWTQRGS